MLRSSRPAGRSAAGRRFPSARHLVPWCSLAQRSSSLVAFRTAEAKDAFDAGQIRWAVEVPDAVRAKLRRDGNSQPRQAADQALVITHAGTGEQEFMTDRGPASLSAWWIQGPQTIGPIWVLDPSSNTGTRPGTPQAHRRWRQLTDNHSCGPSNCAPTAGRSCSHGSAHTRRSKPSLLPSSSRHPPQCQPSPCERPWGLRAGSLQWGSDTTSKPALTSLLAVACSSTSTATRCRFLPPSSHNKMARRSTARTEVSALAPSEPSRHRRAAVGT